MYVYGGSGKEDCYSVPWHERKFRGTGLYLRYLHLHVEPSTHVKRIPRCANLSLQSRDDCPLLGD